MFQYEEGRFYLNDDSGKKLAEVTFKSSNDNVYILDSTWVDPSLRGKGLAQKLVDNVVEKARNESKKIVPLCSYARILFERNEKYSDVWEK